MFLLNQTTHRMLMRHHPTVGHMWVPGLKARIPHENGGYLARTNTAGFRSDIEFKPRKGDRPRILFFGDSMTAGDGCDNHQRYPEVLGKMLGVEIFNYGLSGSGTDQQLLILEEMTSGVEADLIVLGVYVENIQRNMVSARPTIERATGRTVMVPKPYFTLDGDALSLHNVPVPTDRGQLATQQNDTEIVSPIHKALSKTASAIRKNMVLQKVLGPLVSSSTAEYTPLRSVVPRLTGFQPTPEYDDPGSEACRLLKGIIHRFQAACGDIPLVVMPIPTQDHLLGRAKANFQQFFSGLEESGIHTVDLQDSLSRLPLKTRRRIPFDHDAHLSPFGHEQVARILAGEIRLLGIETQTPVENTAPPQRSEYVLGLSCFYHNSAACLLRDGEIVAAAEEERFTRVKQDRRFPSLAINYCLEEIGINVDDLASIAFYDDPNLTFERLLATLAEAGEDGLDQWRSMMPSWVCYKLRIPELIRKELHYSGPIKKTLHHRSHAASAFLASPFEHAAILTIDGVGEWTTASIGRGNGSNVELIKEMRFPHSLGLLYSAFTQFLGFKVNSGEYKMMGLAPYGQPKYKDAILEHLVKLGKDGSIRLQMDKFAFVAKQAMAGEAFSELFGPPRKPESPIAARDLDLARSVQAVTEEAVLRMVTTAHQLTGEENLCMAGGVALNCVANGRILREGPFKQLWIQPAAGDAGGALGAALDVWHNQMGRPRTLERNLPDAQKASLLGPDYGENEILAFLESHTIPHRKLGREERADVVAELAAEGKVIGHFAGRSEYGPRALGARSIIGDPRNTEMQSILNLKIKYRESFRPFAPIVLEECIGDYFDLDRPSPYMLIVAPVVEDRRLPFTIDTSKDVHDMVRVPRSDIPAITHVDYSARIQSVGRASNRALRDVMLAFRERTGFGVMVNTSFNVRGEPIVNTPEEAYRCFMRTEMDVLVLEDFLLLKKEQPPYPDDDSREQASSTSFETGLTDQLNIIFFQEFLPAAKKLAVPLDMAPDTESSWLDWKEPEEDFYRFPEGFDSPDEAAREITASWTDSAMARQLKPCIAAIMAVGDAHSRETALVEEVSNQMYVMF